MSTRILIADDHVVIRKMLKALVETHEGWEVCGEAENGRDAVTKAQELKPDLMIMDMAMPVMDGIRASRELTKAMPTVPILMHTLHYSAELEAEARKAGIRRVVAKVDSGEELLNAIEGLLLSRAPARDMAHKSVEPTETRTTPPSSSVSTPVVPVRASEHPERNSH